MVSNWIFLLVFNLKILYPIKIEMILIYLVKFGFSRKIMKRHIFPYLSYIYVYLWSVDFYLCLCLSISSEWRLGEGWRLDDWILLETDRAFLLEIRFDMMASSSCVSYDFIARNEFTSSVSLFQNLLLTLFARALNLLVDF